MKNALVILAGGKGKRLNNSKIPKQFIKIDNKNIIEYFLDNLSLDIFDIINIVVNNYYKKKYLNKLKKNYQKHNIIFTKSGNNRQESSKNGVLSLKKYKLKNILIHDAARPLASNILIKRLIKSLDINKAVIPYIKNNDFIRSINKKNEKEMIDLIYLQTPQAFRYSIIYKAHNLTSLFDSKDDSSLVEDIGIKNKFIKGEKLNFKITYNEDVEIFNRLKFKEFRSGIGYDIHKFNMNSKKKLVLCGVKIPFYPLDGHSDADVGYHAICDSILGALSKRDIGTYFNNKNKKWKNANSKIFMIFCKNLLDINNYEIINLDVNFISEKPKINKYHKKMKDNISRLLNIKIKDLSIKATTNEKVGFIGKGKAIAAESIIQIKKC